MNEKWPFEPAGVQVGDGHSDILTAFPRAERRSVRVTIEMGKRRAYPIETAGSNFGMEPRCDRRVGSSRPRSQDSGRFRDEGAVVFSSHGQKRLRNTSAC